MSLPIYGEDTQELATLQRRRKLAQALMEQGTSAAPANPMQAIARVVQAYLGTKMGKGLDQEEQAYGQGQQKKLADALQSYTQKLQGAPGVTPLTPNDDEGNPMPSSPPAAPDQQGAAMALVNSGIPALQQAGVGQMFKGEEAYTLKPGERRMVGQRVVADLPLKPELGKPSPEHYTPQSLARFAVSGNYSDLEPKQETPKVGSMRSRIQGQTEVQEEFDGKGWKQIGSGPRFKPDTESKGQYDPARGVVVDPRTATSRPVTDAQGKPLIPPEKPLTEVQGNAAAFGMRANAANEIIKDLEAHGAPLGSVTGMLANNRATNVVAPEWAQKAAQAKLNFMSATLRKESGAAISQSEYTAEDRKYFPQPGDTQATIEQKRNMRDLAIKTLKVQAGQQGGKQIDSQGGGGWGIRALD